MGIDEELHEPEEPDVDMPRPSGEASQDERREHADEELFAAMPDGADGPIGEKFDPEPKAPRPGNSRIPKSLKSPILPSAEDVEDHFRQGHVDYRDWCPVCVKSKGREDPHRRDAQEPEDKTGLPIVSLDYQVLNEDTPTEQRLIIGKDESSGNLLGHHVICKGLGDEWVLKQLAKDFQDMGRAHMILKTDGENAIKAVQNKLQGMRDGRTVPRNPPAYDPQSNGPCEKAVQDVTNHLRTVKLALEYRLKVDIRDDLPIMQWALEHAVFLLNMFHTGSDGMTAYERLTGRKWRRPLVEFGEKVLAKLKIKVRQRGEVRKQKRKMAAKCVEAVWVGQLRRTGEHIVILPSGDAARCRTIRRVPFEHRWNPEKVLLVKGTPRVPAPSRAQSHKIENRFVDEEFASVEGNTEGLKKKDGDGGANLADPSHRGDHDGPRELRITEAILTEYGYTAGCPGCEWKLADNPGHRAHSAECRRRLYADMEATDAGRVILEEVRKRLKRKRPRVEEGAADPDGRGAPRDEPAAPEDDPHATPVLRPGEEPMLVPDIDPIDAENEPNDSDGNDSELPDALDTDVDMGPGIDSADAKTEDRPDDPLADLKRQFDDEGFDDESPLEKRRKCVAPLFEKPKPITDVGRAMSAEGESSNGTLAQLASITSRDDVKRLIAELEKSPALRLPQNHRQRRTLAQQQQKGQFDIAEVYSPPRITEMARRLGLRGGWALDLTETDPEDGKPWDLSDPNKRARAKRLVNETKPFMVIASPMCGPFSALQEVFNYPKLPEAEVKEKLKSAIEHLKFAAELCVMQWEAGRFFLLEHPACAFSWSTQVMQTLIALAGAYLVKFDFCMVGMETTDADGNAAPAKKRTAVVTNSSAIATVLREAQCHGLHKHEVLLNGKAGPCQQYPDKFCKLVCEGVRREMDTVEWKNRLLKTLDITTSFGQLMAVQQRLEEALPPEEDPFARLYEGADFFDDVSGMPLDKKMASEARRTEIEYFRHMGVYMKVRREPWMKVITTRWLDTNKGDAENPSYRARLVGRELNLEKKPELFAAPPPTESLRMLLSICASNQYLTNPEERFVVMSNDVRRAYFYAPASRPIFVQIPAEDWMEGDEGYVGQLNLSLYGTRDAALNWTKTYTEFLISIGFEAGRASPCNFVHRQRSISLTVHGDDFTSTGTEANLRWLDGQLKSKFDIKTDVLGPRESHVQQVRVLNRVLTWTPEGIQYEADQRHAEILIKAMDVSKGTVTPGTKEDMAKAGSPNATALKGNGEDVELLKVEDFEDDGDKEASTALGAADASTFRALAARANYLAQDRPEIQYAVKEIARRMATPTGRDWALLKRLARYLVTAPRGVLQFWWQEMPKQLDVFVDSDFAGCKSTARSTSGGAARWGWHTVKSWSATQATIALSSGEAELYSIVKGASQTLGLIAMAADFGYEVKGTIHTDANAAIGIASRQGLGKTRHVRVQYLWVQERARGGDLAMRKVLGTENPADLLTKHLAASDMVRHLEALGVTTRGDRAEAAPQLATVQGQQRARQQEACSRRRPPEDAWQHDGSEATRVHWRPRLELFTPLRVEGAPPARRLTAARVTRGRYCDTGEEFEVVDNWTARATAHARLGRSWIGTTSFLLRSEGPRNVFTAKSQICGLSVGG